MRHRRNKLKMANFIAKIIIITLNVCVLNTSCKAITAIMIPPMDLDKVN